MIIMINFKFPHYTMKVLSTQMQRSHLISTLVVMGFVVITAMAPARADWKVDPDAIQRIYMNGVPQTDRNGQLMMKYDPARSFFPIAIYHAIEGEDSGVTLADLKAAGFNSAFAWPGESMVPMAKKAVAAGMQMIFWNPSAAEVKALVDNPAVLGWCMADEPIGHFGVDMEEEFQKMEQRRTAIRQIDKKHPVFQVDASWIQPPATSWWIKLNDWSDISSFDNYPINGRNLSLSDTGGLPETVSLAVASNKERKPVWFVAQDHEYIDATFNCTFPSVTQQRCMVYTALIHGATGIVQFALDSFVTRDGRVVGIASNPQAKYSIGTVATSSQLRQSRDLWNATVSLNSELKQLAPALLSPTADIPYEIALDDKWKPITKDPIRCLLKTNPAGGYILLLANIDSAPQHVRVRFPGKKYKMTELFNAPGAEQCEQKGDAIDFLSAPYDVRVFQIDMQK